MKAEDIKFIVPRNFTLIINYILKSKTPLTTIVTGPGQSDEFSTQTWKSTRHENQYSKPSLLIGRENQRIPPRISTQLY